MVDPAEPGICRCLSCNWLFVSPDPVRVRRCADCKARDDGYEPRTASVAQVHGAVVHTQREKF